MFKYMVIGKGGVPLFEYPHGIEGNRFIHVDSILFSGLMSAINTYSIEATGEIVNELAFGSIHATFSKDHNGNLYVVLTNDEIPLEFQKQIHIEIKALFFNFLKENNLSINSVNGKNLHSLERLELDEKMIKPYFDPFYRSWKKKIKSYNLYSAS